MMTQTSAGQGRAWTGVHWSEPWRSESSDWEIGLSGGGGVVQDLLLVNVLLY